MSSHFDASARHLFKQDPHGWLKLIGIQADDVELINVDMTAVQAAADLAVLIGKENREAIHLELQSYPDSHIDDRMLFYSVAIGREQYVPVRSFLILFRPSADRKDITGVVTRRTRANSTYLEFRYDVVRLWKLPVESVFNSALSVVPLAFISDVLDENLPDLIRRAEDRFRKEAEPGFEKDLWTATYFLLGLRHERSFVIDLFKFVGTLKDSTTYQGAIEEGVAIGEARGEARGEVREARKILLRQGTRRFGAPSAETLSALNAIDSVQRLEDLVDRMLIVASWTELLAN